MPEAERSRVAESTFKRLQQLVPLTLCQHATADTSADVLAAVPGLSLAAAPVHRMTTVTRGTAKCQNAPHAWTIRAILTPPIKQSSERLVSFLATAYPTEPKAAAARARARSCTSPCSTAGCQSPHRRAVLCAPLPIVATTPNVSGTARLHGPMRRGAWLAGTRPASHTLWAAAALRRSSCGARGARAPPCGLVPPTGSRAPYRKSCSLQEAMLPTGSRAPYGDSCSALRITAAKENGSNLRPSPL